MATWREFEQSSPEIAAAGHKLLYQFGPGLGFLATAAKMAVLSSRACFTHSFSTSRPSTTT